MTKVQKIGLDGKPHLYWHFSEEELAKMREKKAKEQKANSNKN